MTVIGYTIVSHMEDGSTTTLKVTAAQAAAIIAAAGGRTGSKYTYLNADTCPVHGKWKAIPAGVSKTSGKAYDAFWTCDVEQGEPRCTNRPSKEWIETHPPHMAAAGGADQAPTPEPTGTSSAGEYDDLPF